MGLYLDTSCLLKLLFPEPESLWTARQVAKEDRVVVTSLARLEALVQVEGRRLGGLFSARQAAAVAKALDALLLQSPYELVTMPRDAIDVAEQQLKRRAVHCRTLDRLHLSAMQSLGLSRILTNDNVQLKAAVALGFHAISPSA